MPYVVDYEIPANQPTKRQRLTASKMTRIDKASKEGIISRRHGNDQDDDRIAMEEATQEPAAVEDMQEIRTSNREELMECIKRGQKPKWVPKPSLEALCAEEDALHQQRIVDSFGQEHKMAGSSAVTGATEHASIDPLKSSSNHTERGRAFHSGDFRSGSPALQSPTRDTYRDPFIDSPTSGFSTSPPPWLASDSLPPIGRAISDPRSMHTLSTTNLGRHRAPSLGSSLSSSFVMRTPTSPLVHAVSNSAIDVTSDMRTEVSLATERQNRRRTMPPNSFHSLHMSSGDGTPNFSRPLPQPHTRRDGITPSHTHQMRRSLSSFTYQPSVGPQTPQTHVRRTSLVLDSSPRQRTSMVGSFEESILRGRMSSPPSKPFDFIAQIGVMGKGECPASLQCPAHVTVPFRAVFYSYPTSNNARTISDDAPSPYVGTIDLESNLKPIQFITKQRKNLEKEEKTSETPDGSNSSGHPQRERPLSYDRQRQKQRSGDPVVRLGGAYRVPQQGQLQIIIKNPNKSAVKLFLIPYDLEGMSSGTKTFVRQRCYSSGLIVEKMPGWSSVGATVFDPLKDKSVLRYLIHLKFCCPAKGRYYLHDSIRVVFANRVPDGKEKLRNEIQLPEPRYSIYRPLSSTPKSARSSGADFLSLDPNFASPSKVLNELAVLRSPESLSIPEEIPEITSSRQIHHMQGRTNYLSDPASKLSFFSESDISQGATLPPSSAKSTFPERALSPVQGFLPSTSARASPIPWGSSSASSTNRSFSPVPVEAGSGLLSRQFRTLNGLSESLKLDSLGNSPRNSSNDNLTRNLSYRSKSSQDEE